MMSSNRGLVERDDVTESQTPHGSSEKSKTK